MELYSEVLVSSRHDNGSIKVDSPGIESIHLNLFDKLADMKNKAVAHKTTVDLFTKGSALMNTTALLQFFLRG